MFPENKTGKSFFSFLTSRNSTYRNSICSMTAWPFMRSKNCLIFFFRDTSRKFLILLSSYFPVFWLRISSAFAIIFTDCYGLSCMHVWASSYPTLFQVSLGGVGLRCVGLAQKISAHCNTGFYVFSFFFIWIFILFLALSQLCIFIPSARSLRFGSRLWKVNIDQNWNPSLSLLVSENPCYL